MMNLDIIKYLIFILLPVIHACSEERSDERIRKEILQEAINYASGNVSVKYTDTTETGNILIGDNTRKFIINPAKLITGLIDDDDRKDGIITLYSLENHVPGPTEHLIFLQVDDRFILARSVESDMRILSLTDRIITAELPKYPRSSPLHNCADCQEIVRYSYKNGDLERLN